MLADRLARRGLVVGLARFRPGRRRRPLRPDRAEGASSPPTATATPARRSTSPTSSRAIVAAPAAVSPDHRRARCSARADALAAALPEALTLDDALAPFAAQAGRPSRALPFAHPLYILFSSGTTGVPKCIVHSAGGTLLQHLKEHRLHCGIGDGDRVFYFTTLGWMMWNWLVSALASGATLLLYDGSPFHPVAGGAVRLRRGRAHAPSSAPRRSSSTR